MTVVKVLQPPSAPPPSLRLRLFLFVGSEEAFWQSLEGLREQIVSDDYILSCLHAHWLFFSVCACASRYVIIVQ